MAATDEEEAAMTSETPHGELQKLYHDGVIDGVALVAADAAACQTCTAISDRVYLPSRLPPLPISGCTGSNGCRCRYEPSFTVYE